MVSMAGNLLRTYAALLNKAKSTQKLHHDTVSISIRLTPPRTHRINGVKSQILKPTFWLKNDDEKWSRFFYFEIQ